jgi:hypothetical protein
MNDHDTGTDQREVDAGQSEHERRVAEIEERRAPSPEGDPTLDEGRRPTSSEDLAADRTPGDEDVVGDDMSSPGQNSDRLPQ